MEEVQALYFSVVPLLTRIQFLFFSLESTTQILLCRHAFKFRFKTSVTIVLLIIYRVARPLSPTRKQFQSS